MEANSSLSGNVLCKKDSLCFRLFYLYIIRGYRLLIVLYCVLIAIVVIIPSALAQETESTGAPADAVSQNPAVPAAVPVFKDPNRRLERPETVGFSFIRFITTDDFPPFNYVTPDGRLAGFNIDLARAICEEMQLGCVVQVRPWASITDTIGDARENAIIAAVAMTPESRETLAFTAPYLTTPARFVGRTDASLPELTVTGLTPLRLGAVVDSAHARFLATYYPDARRFDFTSTETAKTALKDGAIDLIFGDAIDLAFWLNGAGSENCCRFVGGPYLESRFFGEGLAIAVAPDNTRLRAILDFALDRLSENGRHAEIYLKHFPVGIY